MTRKFHFVNRATSALKIRHAQPDCGCLVTDAFPINIPAGAAFDWPVVFRVPAMPGRFGHTIQIAVDEPVEQFLNLKAVGIVASSNALVTPTTRVDFGTVVLDATSDMRKPVVRAIALARADGTPVGEIVLRSNDRIVLVGTPEPTTRLHHGVLVTLQLNPEALATGCHRFPVTIASVGRKDHDSSGELLLDCHVEIREPESPFVPSLFVQRILTGETVSRSLLRDRANGPLFASLGPISIEESAGLLVALRSDRDGFPVVDITSPPSSSDAPGNNVSASAQSQASIATGVIIVHLKGKQYRIPFTAVCVPRTAHLSD